MATIEARSIEDILASAVAKVVGKIIPPWHDPDAVPNNHTIRNVDRTKIVAGLIDEPTYFSVNALILEDETHIIQPERESRDAARAVKRQQHAVPVDLDESSLNPYFDDPEADYRSSAPWYIDPITSEPPTRYGNYFLGWARKALDYRLKTGKHPSWPFDSESSFTTNTSHRKVDEVHHPDSKVWSVGPGCDYGYRPTSPRPRPAPQLWVKDPATRLGRYYDISDVIATYYP